MRKEKTRGKGKDVHFPKKYTATMDASFADCVFIPFTRERFVAIVPNMADVKFNTAKKVEE